MNKNRIQVEYIEREIVLVLWAIKYIAASFRISSNSTTVDPVRNADIDVRPTTSLTSTSPTFVLNTETSLEIEDMRYLHDNADTYPFHISDTAAAFRGDSSLTVQATARQGVEIGSGLAATTFENWCFDIGTPSNALIEADSNVELSGGSVRFGGSKLNDGNATVTRGPNVASGSTCEKPTFP